MLAHAQLLAGLGTSPTAATTLLVAPKCGSLQDFEVWMIDSREIDGMDGHGALEKAWKTI